MNPITQCPICGTDFEKTKSNRKFCSKGCQMKHNSNVALHRKTYGTYYDPEKFPNAAHIECVKCEKTFSSWDKTKNHLCPKCRSGNEGQWLDLPIKSAISRSHKHAND